MSALIEAAKDPDFPASISLVISNRPEAEGLNIASVAGIKAVAIDHKLFETREAFDRVMHELLTAHGIKFVCLAGFMRLLSPWLTHKWQGRMLNIHPSLLPAYKGLDTHARALNDGQTRHGCTVHFVTEGLDDGPIVAQSEIAILPGDTPESLAARVLIEEHKLYPLALARVAAQRRHHS